MRVEILIWADVVIHEDDTTSDLKKEIKNEVRKNISRWTGSPYHNSNLDGYLKNIDHEMTFDDEGLYDYVSKKYNPNKFKELKEDIK